MPDVITKRLFSTKEAAKYLGKSAWTIRMLVQNGELPVVRGCEECNWQFDIHDLDEYIERHRHVFAGE